MTSYSTTFNRRVFIPALWKPEESGFVIVSASLERFLAIRSESGVDKHSGVEDILKSVGSKSEL